MPKIRKIGFKNFSHTADIGLHVIGKRRKELFENAAWGALSLLTDSRGDGETRKIPVSLKSESWESLLILWLQEILYIFSVKKICPSKIEILSIKLYSLRASLSGKKFDPSRLRIFREIKAATYHNLKIRKVKTGYSADIIFDI
jgi:SHS2 domain-containing protein